MLRRIGWGVLALALLVAGLAPAGAQDDGNKISEFGRYEGYSNRIYRGIVRESLYVEVRDGTRLAVDVYHPMENGQPVDDPLPVIWVHTRYQRAAVDTDGTIMERGAGGQELVPYGYVLGVVDVRGGGASFGVRRTEFTQEEAQDAYDITEWFAAQPWCDGSVGMIGRSYLGISQLFAASQAPPHLRAIFPEMHMFDLYDLVYQNGIYMRDFVEKWDAIVQGLDNSTMMQVAPVDDDPDGALLAEALALRPQNGYPLALTQKGPYRDSQIAGGNFYGLNSLSSYTDAINASGVAIYQVGGWFDMYTTDPLLWFANLTVPNKLVMPPWDHQGWENWLPVERLRWFDYWLKGIDNGIMDEPPLRYFVMGVNEWRTTDAWPLPTEQRTPFYMAAGPSGSVVSVNDGLLSLDPPGDAAAWDEYTVDYTTTMGPANRYAAGRGGEFGFPNLLRNDQRALTYTTPALDEALEITGHPVAHLWITAATPDVDVFVYLEDVSLNRTRVVYVTEGKLRASHRALADPPWDNLGLPWHRSNEADVVPLPEGEPVELVFDLKPVSVVFPAGHHLRITITGADADTFETPHLTPPPVISLYRDAEHASYIDLPVIPAE